MSELIGIVVFIAIVVGLAAGVLFVLDRVTLRSGLTAEERKSIVEKRTRKWRRRWLLFYVVIASIALVVNGLNLNHESLKSRISWSIPAAIVIILFLLSKDEKAEDTKE
jgi:FlaG/FlaF family flagellin (archaellin)